MILLWPVFLKLEGLLNVQFEIMILLLFFTGSLVFYVKDFRIGSIISMLGYFLLFMWFYSAGLNYFYVLTLALIQFCIIALTLFTLGKRLAQGGIV